MLFSSGLRTFPDALAVSWITLQTVSHYCIFQFPEDFGWVTVSCNTPLLMVSCKPRTVSRSRFPEHSSVHLLCALFPWDCTLSTRFKAPISSDGPLTCRADLRHLWRRFWRPYWRRHKAVPLELDTEDMRISSGPRTFPDALAVSRITLQTVSPYCIFQFYPTKVDIGHSTTILWYHPTIVDIGYSTLLIRFTSYLDLLYYFYSISLKVVVYIAPNFATLLFKRSHIGSHWIRFSTQVWFWT